MGELQHGCARYWLHANSLWKGVVKCIMSESLDKEHRETVMLEESERTFRFGDRHC